MPEILRLETTDWTLVVWTKDVDTPRNQLIKTLAMRQKPLPVSSIHFLPALKILNAVPEGITAGIDHPIEELTLQQPIFFENRLYEFDFQFSRSVEPDKKPSIIHWLNSVSDAFHFSGSSLRGSINFGNDVGWFRLGIKSSNGRQDDTQFVSFEVLPTKMDMAGDFDHIHKIIDKTYPLWRFSFAQKTDQELSRARKPHERFTLLWLANFRSLREELENAVKLICRSPHSRLLPEEKFLRPDRLKGRLSPRLEERVVRQCREGEVHRRHRVETKKLSVNTPENRFVKMVMTRCVRELTAFIQKARLENNAPDRERLSNAFFAELEGWRKPLLQRLAEPLFREVGNFKEMAGESLVLHHRAGYTKVYRIWQELKLYLDLFGRHASISLKSIDELYEVWCFLEIRRILLSLGFSEDSERKASLRIKGLEKGLVDGMGAAFNLLRHDGLKIRLAHEPRFACSKNPTIGNIYSWTTTQKPDILLEVTFPDGERIRWIFDAKYRIATDDREDDGIPDDAINQMHRYRDALIHLSQADDGAVEKSRPVVGAFVLYPGWFDEENETNPYTRAIEAVGIGGFPLLPGSENSWLKQFLVERFGDLSAVSIPYPEPDPDEFFIRDPVRIYPTGLSLNRYSDLTLVSQPKKYGGDYDKCFSEGTARWYHIPASTTENRRIPRSVMRELCHCAFAVHHRGSRDRMIEYIYDVISVKLVRRSDMTLEQAGRVNIENHNDYWLIELDRSRPIVNPIVAGGKRSFRFRLTGAKDLMQAESWSDIPKRYRSLTNY